MTEYRVHRSTTADFTPSAANRVATVTSGTTYTDPGLATGTYYYRVVAADAAGNASQPSSQASVRHQHRHDRAERLGQRARGRVRRARAPCPSRPTRPTTWA